MTLKSCACLLTLSHWLWVSGREGQRDGTHQKKRDRLRNSKRRTGTAALHLHLRPTRLRRCDWDSWSHNMTGLQCHEHHGMHQDRQKGRLNKTLASHFRRVDIIKGGKRWNLESSSRHLKQGQQQRKRDQKGAVEMFQRAQASYLHPACNLHHRHQASLSHQIFHHLEKKRWTKCTFLTLTYRDVPLYFNSKTTAGITSFKIFVLHNGHYVGLCNHIDIIFSGFALSYLGEWQHYKGQLSFTMSRRFYRVKI